MTPAAAVALASAPTLAAVPDSALVALGGAVGAVARHLIGFSVDREAFPLGTLTVNVLGSFLLGLLTFWPVGGDAFLLAGTGACGAFTTFSSFSVSTVRLWERGDRRRAALFVAGNTLLAGAAVASAAAVATVAGSGGAA